MKRSNKASSSKQKELPFTKWYKSMLGTEGDNLVEQFSQIRPILSDPAYLDGTFAALVGLGLPSEKFVSSPWNYDVEKGRFKAAFIRGKKSPTGKVVDQPKYLMFVMKLLKNDSNFYSVEELKKKTLVESLKFMITFFATAVEAEKETEKLWRLCLEQLHRLECLLRRGDKCIDKEEDDRLAALWTLQDVTFHLVNKLFDMNKTFSKHLGNIMLKCNFTPRCKDPNGSEEIKVEITVVEKMKRLAQRIEILGNLVVAEKDPVKQKKFKEDLKNEQKELNIFVINKDTVEELSYLVLRMIKLVDRTTQNNHIVDEMLQKIIACLKRYNHEVTDYNIEWLALSSRRR